MPSPFPGMDPYLEAHWGDIHHCLITYARDQLQGCLPNGLFARTEEHVFVETPEEGGHSIVPDLRVLEKNGAQRGAEGTSRGAVVVAVAEPLVLVVDDPTPQGYVEIREAGLGRRLVTVIEVLGPSNKRAGGELRSKYLKKIYELHDAGVSVVEIDLLRGGDRPLPVAPSRIRKEYRTDYQVVVRPGWNLAEVHIYAVPLRQSLPAFRVPLREKDQPVILDLQTLVDQCYRNGGYEQDLDYEQEPEPRFGRADAEWADALLRKAGRRKKARRTRRS